jgi:hypothetical protein
MTDGQSYCHCPHLERGAITRAGCVLAVVCPGGTFSEFRSDYSHGVSASPAWNTEVKE